MILWDFYTKQIADQRFLISFDQYQNAEGLYVCLALLERLWGGNISG
jgi:hypothetical protein